LEADELFTFVQMKVNQIRIWIVQCRRTRQILSFFIGDGSMESCKRLWRKLPPEYLGCKSFSDLWRSYNCIPTETHQKVGKETGQTNHIERFNNTLRQRVSRLVRKTLSFSKKEYMLNLHFKLFAFFYNQKIATHF
jgi:insertion element IS1 protein InsB